MLLILVTPAYAQSPTSPQNASQEDFMPKQDLKADWIAELHLCENRGNTPRILDVNGKYSYGYVMYQMETWLTYSKRFGTTPENIKDKDLQIEVTKYILDNGGWKNWWTCAISTKAKLGAYPK